MKINCSKFEFVFFVFGSAFIVSFFFCLLYSMAVHGNLLRNSDYSSHVIHDQNRFSKRTPVINNHHPLSDSDGNFNIRIGVQNENPELQWNSSSQVKVMTEDAGMRNNIMDQHRKWSLDGNIHQNKVEPS